MKKRIIRLVILVAVVAAAFYGVRRYNDNGNGSEPGVLKIYGTVDIRDAGLAFNEQERIAEILVEEGQHVEKGQVLARLRADRLEAVMAEARAKIQAQEEVVKRLKAGSRPQEIEQAKAEVEAVRVRVANAAKVVARLQKTSGSGATSEQDLDDARSQLSVEKARLTAREKALNLVVEGPRKEDIAAAQHRLASMKSGLSLLQIRHNDLALVAPAAGTVQSRILEPGEMASPSRPVLTLALTEPKWVRAYIPEPYLGHVKTGTKSRIVSDSYPGRSFDGWVGFVSPVAEFTPRTVQTEELRTKLVYEARVFVHDREDLLRLGMPVTVILDDESEKDDIAAMSEEDHGTNVSWLAN